MDRSLFRVTRAVEPYARAALFALLSLVPSLAKAETLAISLSEPALIDGSLTTGLWDVAGGRLRAQVTSNAALSGLLDFGTGMDGDFVNGPAQSGITVSGTTITFNTDVKATYNFRRFTLSSGYTARATGSAPLTIRILGSAVIAGTLSADGTTGSANSSGAGSTGGTGGAGSAGGGAGGAGINGSGAGGGAGAAAAPGGKLGQSAGVSLSYRGGGGGCNGTGDAPNDAEDGYNVSGANGAKGTCATARAALGGAFETTFTAGAGGGGGGAYTAGGTMSGGGGGGGGGSIRLMIAGGLTNTGTIRALGGDGGPNDSGDGIDCGSGGGGGSGGSVWLQTYGGASGGGTLNVTGGARGQSVLCTALQTYGGKGSRGIIRTDGTSTLTTSPAGAADATATLTHLAGQSYTLVSSAIDFTTRYVNFDSVTESISCGAIPANGTLAVTYQGSSDGVTWSSAVSASQISTLSQYDFLRFRVDITTASVTPPCLAGLSLGVSLKNMTQFQMRGGLACGSTIRSKDASGDSKSVALTSVAEFLLIVFVARLFSRRKKFIKIIS